MQLLDASLYICNWITRAWMPNDSGEGRCRLSLLNAMQGTGRGPRDGHRNFHLCSLQVRSMQPRHNVKCEAHRTRSASGQNEATPTKNESRKRLLEPLHQIMAVIIQHMQDAIDPNTTPLILLLDLPAFRLRVYRQHDRMIAIHIYDHLTPHAQYIKSAGWRRGHY